MATDPVRTAAEQLTDWLETNAVIGGTGAVFASRPAEEEIYAFARQQRKEAQDDLIAEQREWDCKYGCDGRDSCLLPDVLERAEAAEARIAVLEGELAALRAERGAEGPRCILCGDPESKHAKSPADWRTVPGCSKFTPPAASSGDTK